MDDRPSWDEVWMDMAEAIGRRSRCLGAQVGAVIVDVDQKPVAVGYNGPPRHFPAPGDSRCDQWCTRRQRASQAPQYGLLCPAIHAEANALMAADRQLLKGATIYVTRACCADCTKLVSNSGISRVVVKIYHPADDHRSPMESVSFLEKCGIAVDVLDIKEEP